MVRRNMPRLSKGSLSRIHASSIATRNPLLAICSLTCPAEMKRCITRLHRNHFPNRPPKRSMTPSRPRPMYGALSMVQRAEVPATANFEHGTLVDRPSTLATPAAALDVVVRWDDWVLAVHELSPPRPFFVGEQNADVI